MVPLDPHRTHTAHRMERTGTARSPCLLSNWVEERATASLDCDSSAGTGTGHRGILTPELLAKLMDSTTYRDSYTQLPGTSNCQRGQREELLKKFLYEKFRKEILSEINSSAQEPTLTESTTKRDYQVEGFIPRKPQPSRTHDYRTEQPVTFWAENVRSITGVSDTRTKDTPFRKSSRFSAPISEYLDQPVPYSLENYPNM
uniref:Sperm-associated antigen 8 n=2 Tax=Xenopus tropicalis TaxID=8364 RepID=A0A803J3Y5_XENTR